jgi:thermitase
VVGGDTDEYVAQWALTQMRLPEAQAISAGAGITIALLDTGVDLTHPMLREHLVAGYDFVDDDADPSEVGEADVDHAYGHGTHVAGLLALAAPEAQIMPLRTLDQNGRGTIWAQIKAVRYAIAHGATVINLSYSFDEPSLIFADVLSRVTCSRGAEPMCQSPQQPGVVVVAAAGNSGLAVREYPAADRAPGILAVGATTRADNVAAFSTYGAWVPIGAPGDCILSTAPGGGYATWSGTSMAAPLVAGSVALVRSRYPQLRPSEAAVQVKITAAPIDSKIRRRVDAAAALTQLAR